MELKKKQGIYLMLAGAVVLAGVLVFVFGMPDTAPGDTPTATTTEPVATTTDIFDMEPIVPEAKVSTEGWKTCRNEKYGYEFKFPAEWNIYGEDALSEPNPHPISRRVYVRESEECNGASVLLTAVEPWSGVVATSGDGELYVEVRSSVLSMDGYWRDYIARLHGRTGQQYIELDKNMAVLGVSNWARVDGSRAWGVGSYYQQKVFRLYGSFFDEQSPNIYTILSTFHFLDTASTTTTTD